MEIEIRDDMLTCGVDRTTAETLRGKLKGDWTQADFERLIKLFDAQRSFNRLMTQTAMGVWPVDIDENGIITIGDGDNGFDHWMETMWRTAQEIRDNVPLFLAPKKILEGR